MESKTPIYKYTAGVAEHHAKNNAPLCTVIGRLNGAVPRDPAPPAKGVSPALLLDEEK
jgi:hypothetical protein